jgi:hypothetical protein
MLTNAAPRLKELLKDEAEVTLKARYEYPLLPWAAPESPASTQLYFVRKAAEQALRELEHLEPEKTPAKYPKR